MLMSIMSSFTHWMTQVRMIVGGRLAHLNPEEYACLLVVGISLGFLLLRGKR